jgi:hypothetical protein
MKKIHFATRMDTAWSGRGGGGALPALVPSCVGHVCRPPINLLHYCKVLLYYCIWIVIVVHSSLIIMLLLKLLYLILLLITFCFIMKNSTPLYPLARARGVHTPPPRKSIPVATYTIRARMIASFGWFVLELYHLSYNNSSYSETSCYSVFYNTHPPPKKKDSTNQGPPPSQFCHQNRFNLMVTVLRIY